MTSLKQKWIDMLGTPPKSKNYGKSELVSKISHKEFDAEIYQQENGEGKYQRVMLVLPKTLKLPHLPRQCRSIFPKQCSDLIQKQMKSLRIIKTSK